MAQTGSSEPAKQIEQQAIEQTGQRQVRLQIDERNMDSCYANMFRSTATADELILDFGLSLPNPGATKDQPEMVFQVSERVILNYYSAKRLAMTLTQLLRRHEEQFGVLEMDVAKRGKAPGA